MATSSRTKSIDVYKALRADILSGELAPGSKLAFSDLATRYSSSIGSLREALQRLAEQELVEERPRRGFHVIAITPEDLRELTDARCEIEVLALRRAIQDGDLEWEAQLVAAHHRLNTSSPFSEGASHFDEAWALAHGAFHHALLAGCGNRRILSAALSLRDSANLYWRWSAPHFDRHRDIALEHQLILEATIDRSEKDAADLLRAHIQRTTDRLLEGAASADAMSSTSTRTV